MIPQGLRSSLHPGRCTFSYDCAAAKDAVYCRNAHAEFAGFVEAVRTGQAPEVIGVDARRALAIALACIELYRGP